MPVTSKPAITRSRIKTIADGLSATIKTRKLGLANIGASTEFFGTLGTAGPYLVIRPARQDSINDEGIRKFSVTLDLYFSFANDADYDFTAIEDVLYATLLPALMLAVNYSDCPAPQSADPIAEPEILTSKKPIVGRYQITLRFTSC